jgi:hypothetical protein
LSVKRERERERASESERERERKRGRASEREAARQRQQKRDRAPAACLRVTLAHPHMVPLAHHRSVLVPLAAPTSEDRRSVHTLRSHASLEPSVEPYVLYQQYIGDRPTLVSCLMRAYMACATLNPRPRDQVWGFVSGIRTRSATRGLLET